MQQPNTVKYFFPPLSHSLLHLMTSNNLLLTSQFQNILTGQAKLSQFRRIFLKCCALKIQELQTTEHSYSPQVSSPAEVVYFLNGKFSLIKEHQEKVNVCCFYIY
uniref:Uncharacterized protein n=1 Tax=Micrurus paraensis TaxID=1970185 RepID=A0A2D4KMZ8_9SAUR